MTFEVIIAFFVRESSKRPCLKKGKDSIFLQTIAPFSSKL
ncbi:hypothetical protein WZ211_2150 [Enterococcus faecalis]|nr:hypothetical protein EFDM72_0889 [Enterococcus faecalis]OSH15442.1 hypothetical protein HS5302_2149 [Enterococcus faecalis]OSH31839.1 hypothetical protein WZ211_2150 [Enterococcus faecalis]OSH44519.1 hypothetical protein YM392_2246 [Enterococcus faecalis]